MKLLKLVSHITVAALAVLALAGASAAEPQLSPRAKENQIVRVPGTTPDLIDRGLLAASPRALAFQASLARINGTEADHLNRGASAVSPRLATAFPDVVAHARSLQASSPAACKTMSAGECKMACCKTKGSCALPCCKS